MTTMDEKTEYLIKFLKDNKYHNPTIRNNNIKPLYDILKLNDIKFVDKEDYYSDCDDEFYEYLGVYFHSKGDTKNMIKYYLMAIEKDNSNAMNNLGCYYEATCEDDNTIKYYCMAIEKGNSVAMNNLGKYYHNKGDTKNMIKCYLMAIEKGNSVAMNNLGKYYHNIGDNENTLKYYLMAIKNGNHSAKSNLSIYLQRYINENIEWIIKNAAYMEPNILKLTNHHISTKNTPFKHTTKKEECCVCYYTTNMALLKCNHDVCFDCVIKINKCPLCRIDL